MTEDDLGSTAAPTSDMPPVGTRPPPKLQTWPNMVSHVAQPSRPQWKPPGMMVRLTGISWLRCSAGPGDTTGWESGGVPQQDNQQGRTSLLYYQVGVACCGQCHMAFPVWPWGPLLCGQDWPLGLAVTHVFQRTRRSAGMLDWKATGIWLFCRPQTRGMPWKCWHTVPRPWKLMADNAVREGRLRRRSHENHSCVSRAGVIQQLAGSCGCGRMEVQAGTECCH